MILVVDGAKVLDALRPGRMDREVLKLIEIPRRCLVCSNYSLVRHGNFWKMVKKNGVKTELPIQRVRCLKCHSTFSCFYDFLVPHRQDSQDDLVVAIEHRLSRMGRGSGRPETSNHISVSTVSRVFKAFLENVAAAFTALQSLTLKSGVNPLTVSQPEFAPAYAPYRRRSRVRVALSLLNLAKHLYGGEHAVLKEISALWLKNYRAELNSVVSARVPPLSRTHRLQYVQQCSILQPRSKRLLC